MLNPPSAHNEGESPSSQNKEGTPAVKNVLDADNDMPRIQVADEDQSMQFTLRADVKNSFAVDS